ncbi:EcoKI restriction-modification system protein HsdS [Legionella quinlivanii]|uniref:EcoKI restriction-modification system protein HsdS n=1 Tax=Legionella quinlivanii TaxID=45073 RepID=A0A0W0Y5N5_9GAMM|nr:restriction endonuclease subunit S [Legionella quinlivanii]KTD52249.1 EcoKI restriction-modification system protein HsdS [Legionella quinlivanii]SEF74512.1 Type I restriction modification DNA specificity domain-containing protein [Legionella quinlivanii DSM 21216]STY12252.1 EcoKI restriction-modification system protein HsdS [Legionella quinlivanii]
MMQNKFDIIGFVLNNLSIITKDANILDLINISTISAGYSFRGKIPELKNSGVYCVQMKDINETYNVNWSTVIETILPSRQSQVSLRSGDILFAARGQRNYAALIDAELRERLAIAAPQFFVIRLNVPDVLPEYIAWFLNQTIAQRYFLSNAEGSTTPSIRRQVLEATPIILPTLKQQKTIIELAKTISKEKHLADKMIANGELLMQTLLNEISQTQLNEEEVPSC